MTLTTADGDGRTGRDAVRSVAKLTLGALSVALLAYLVSLLPGIERLIPGTPVSLVAVVGALASVAIAGLLLYVARRLAAITQIVIDGPDPLVEHVGSILHWLVVLGAVLVAHAGLAPVALPILGDLSWIYDVAFLVLSVPILAVVAARLYVSLDPAADSLADRLTTEA